MKQKKAFLSIGIFFLLSFAIFSLIAKLDFLTQFDFDTTVKIQNHISVRFNQFFSLLSLLARFDITLIILLLIFFGVVKDKLKAVFAIVFFGLAHLVELIGKLYLDHPGPPFMFYRNKNILLFPDLYVVGSSYPSGHSLRAMFIAVILSYILLHHVKNKILSYISLVIVWGTAFSIVLGKIVLGQHWTSDVIGGVILGICFGFFLVFTLQYIQDNVCKQKSLEN